MGIIPAEMRSLMDWFQKLERKYSKYAIQNLMMYIIVLYAVGFVFEVFAPCGLQHISFIGFCIYI